MVLAKRRRFRYFDWPFLLSICFILVLGALALYSATNTSTPDMLRIRTKHFSFLFLGGIFFGVLLFYDYTWINNLRWPIYGSSVLVLVLVLFIGRVVHGSQRWLSLGGIAIQPSEFAKLALIVMLACHFSVKDESTFKDILVGCLYTVVPFLLIFKQPDLGTSLVFLVILGAILFGAGVSVHLFFFLFLCEVTIAFSFLGHFWWMGYICLLFFLLWKWCKILWLTLPLWGIHIGLGYVMPHLWGFLYPYQKKRLTAFINPEADPLGAGYHVLQSKTAIGGGGLWGKGFLQGSQTQLHFIPAQWNDFIFSVIGEEFGFIITTLTLSIFLFLFWRILYIAYNAKDKLGRLLCIGVWAMFFFQTVVNMGMCLGIMPVVGLPLPLLSYGGSSLLVNLMALSLVENVAIHQKKLTF